METYIVRKGQQYDRGGARVEWGSLSAAYTATLTLDAGYLPRRDHRDAVEAVVRRVIETGIPETLVIGTPPPLAPAEADPYMQPCPRCGTYCYGDCR